MPVMQQLYNNNTHSIRNILNRSSTTVTIDQSHHMIQLTSDQTKVCDNITDMNESQFIFLSLLS